MKRRYDVIEEYRHFTIVRWHDEVSPDERNRIGVLTRRGNYYKTVKAARKAIDIFIKREK